MLEREDFDAEHLACGVLRRRLLARVVRAIGNGTG
jgi:hypothetical protein